MNQFILNVSLDIIQLFSHIKFFITIFHIRINFISCLIFAFSITIKG